MSTFVYATIIVFDLGTIDVIFDKSGDYCRSGVRKPMDKDDRVVANFVIPKPVDAFLRPGISCDDKIPKRYSCSFLQL